MFRILYEALRGWRNFGGLAVVATWLYTLVDPKAKITSLDLVVGILLLALAAAIDAFQALAEWEEKAEPKKQLLLEITRQLSQIDSQHEGILAHQRPTA